MQKKSLMWVWLSVVCLFFSYFIDQSEAKSYKNWTTISMEDSLLNLKNWPNKCRLRIRTTANYSSETTVGFCPPWTGSEEPRTYLRLREVFAGYFVSGYDNDFSEHPLFTKWKGGRDSYFADPVIKPGQRTTCNSSDCFFRRIEFSVKGKQCQWIFYAPDYIPARGTIFNPPDKTTPYALEFFTCQTGIPFTKETYPDEARQGNSRVARRSANQSDRQEERNRPVITGG